MDSEVVLAIFMGHGAIHGLLFFHTFLGAIIIAALAVGIGLPLIRWAIRWSNSPAAPNWGILSWIGQEMSVFAAVSGALSGGLSHVFLDAIINTDVAPFAPLSETNPFYGLISRTTLHIALVAFGAVGGAVLYTRRGS